MTRTLNFLCDSFWIVLFSSLIGSSFAHGELLWQFTFSGWPLGAWGQLETTDTLDAEGAYTITGIRGHMSGGPYYPRDILGLGVPNGGAYGCTPSGWEAPDYKLFPSSPYLSSGGFGFYGAYSSAVEFAGVCTSFLDPDYTYLAVQLWTQPLAEPTPGDTPTSYLMANDEPGPYGRLSVGNLSVWFDGYTTPPSGVPEPGTLALLALALGGGMWTLRRGL